MCFEILIDPQHILTSAFCVEMVGPNPIVVISPSGMDDDRWTLGVQVVLWTPISNCSKMGHLYCLLWIGNIRYWGLRVGEGGI